MALTINSNAVEAFNKDAETLLEGVVKKAPSTFTLPQGSFVPEFHAQDIPPEAIQGLTIGQTDIDDVKMDQFVAVAEEFVGLEGEAYKKIQILAGKIYKCPEVNRHLSWKTIERVLFEWVIARHTGQTSDLLLTYCLPKLEEAVIDLFLWVPIFGLATQFSFDLGRTKVYPITKQFFDTWEATFVNHPAMDRAKYQPRIDDFRRRFQGWAACTMKIKAEPTRAYEMAMEETENALAILRVFLPNNLHPSAPSYCRPVGRENMEKDLIFAIHGDVPPVWREGTNASYRPWTLDEPMMDMVINSGLGVLHQLYLLDKKTEFQQALLKSVMTYSRSSLKHEAADRLIYIFTALDSFLLQNQNEPIQQSIADRIAFTISDNAKDRIKIRKSVITAYGMRSQAVHHNQDVQDREAIIEFLNVVFRFYLSMIVRNSQYKTRQDFFDEVDLKKYSGQLPTAEAQAEQQE